MTPPINESPVGTARLARNSFAVRLGSYRTPSLREDQFSVGELLNLELLDP
jgi:hypothetical protein